MSMANMALVPQAAVASEPNSGDLDAASRQDPPLQKQDETFRNARDFIITTSESKFLVHTRDNPSSGPVEFRSGHAKVGWLAQLLGSGTRPARLTMANDSEAAMLSSRSFQIECEDVETR
ncbi:MAG: hypothetical protein QOF14_1889 [Hyphomicrobiales bacterium]|nr:hypothetical protein [Hyphomicrobiales bacterium]